MTTELVVVTTDWKLEDAGAKTYGMCFVRVSPPYDHMNFKRGFSLPCPTHQRCALFALILGMELVDSIPVVTERPEFVISTKNAWVHDTLNRHKVDEWEAKGHWPKHAASLRGLLLRAADVMADLPEGRCTLVHIPRDDDDPDRVSLLSKEEDTDVDSIVRNGGGQKEIEGALRDMRMKGVMMNELITSGALGSRPKKLPPAPEKNKKKKMSEHQKDGSGAEGNDSGPLGGGEPVRTTEEPRADAPLP